MPLRGYIRPFLQLLLTVILISAGSMSVYAKHDSAVAALEERCNASMKNFNYRQLGADASRLLKLLKGKSPHSWEVGYANLFKGVSVMMGDNGSEAYPYLDRALEAGRVTGNDSLVALALNSLGIYEANVNANLYLAQRYFMQSSEAADKVGYTNVKNGVKSNLAEVAAMLDDTGGIKYASWSYNNAVA